LLIPFRCSCFATVAFQADKHRSSGSFYIIDPFVNVQRGLVYCKRVISAVVLAKLHALRCPPLRDCCLRLYGSPILRATTMCPCMVVRQGHVPLTGRFVLISFASIISKLVCHFSSNFSVPFCVPHRRLTRYKEDRNGETMTIFKRRLSNHPM
jgi:hypothetical protein